MHRKNNLTAKTTELLPPEPRRTTPDAELLERLIHEKVSKILASREDLILRPFFDTQRVASELRRLQTMPARRKWAVYFEQFGCLICRMKRTCHRGCGMCGTCYVRTTFRLKTILDDKPPSQRGPRYTGNLESTARKALLEAVESFASAKDGGQ